MKKVSVVIPCYNAAQYLDCCMEHVLGQTIGLENMEIILVNDASTDDGATLGLVMEYERKFPDAIIAISLEQNMRQGGARNVGISYASGEYLMFCDADDWLALEAMEILYGMAKKYDADVVEYRMKNAMDNKKPDARIEQGNASYFREMADEKVKKELLMGSMDNFSLGCICKFYRLSLIQENHIRFAEHLICEEPSFTLPVRLYEKRHVFLDAVLYFYYQSANSTVRGNWDGRKWNNAEVWLILMEDLEQRGFFRQYHEELECMFFDWGFGLTIRMLILKGYRLTKEELEFLKTMVLNLFPHIQQNPYVRQKEEKWDHLLKGLLQMEFTEENAKLINREMRKAIEEENIFGE